MTPTAIPALAPLDRPPSFCVAPDPSKALLLDEAADPEIVPAALGVVLAADSVCIDVSEAEDTVPNVFCPRPWDVVVSVGPDCAVVVAALVPVAVLPVIVNCGERFCSPP